MKNYIVMLKFIDGAPVQQFHGVKFQDKEKAAAHFEKESKEYVAGGICSYMEFSEADVTASGLDMKNRKVLKSVDYKNGISRTFDENGNSRLKSFKYSLKEAV